MKLLSAHIENFGKFSNQNFDFNDGLNERGEPITVVEFTGTAGKNQYCLMQGNRLLDSRYYDEDIFKLVGHIKQTEGVIREVSDEKTTLTVKSVTGEEQEATIKGMPSDIDQSQKQEMIYEIEVIIDKLKTPPCHYKIETKNNKRT